MTQLIAFDIYRTEDLVLNGREYTVSFSKRRDSQEYEIFAVNHDKTKSIRGSYSAETAKDFKSYTGNDLQEAVYNILKDELERP